MSTQCKILAVGRYKPSVKDCLEYDAKHYANATPKNTVMASLFHCPTLDLSTVLCQAFGRNIYHVHEHWLGRLVLGTDLPYKQLEHMQKSMGVDWAADIDDFRLLLAADFFFMIRADF